MGVVGLGNDLAAFFFVFFPIYIYIYIEVAPSLLIQSLCNTRISVNEK